MLIGARNYFSGGGRSRLPYDAEIEYLQSSSAAGQYINTGILFDTTTTKVEITTTVKRWSTDTAYAFGCKSGTATPAFSTDQLGMYHTSRGSYPVIKYLNAISTTGGVMVYDTDDFYTYRIDDTDFSQYDISGNLIKQTTSAGSTKQPPNLAIYLFSCNDDGTLKYVSPNQKVKSFKVWKGDTLVQDLVPVRIGQEGMMYDNVTGALFRNEGTGAFTLGVDKQ